MVTASWDDKARVVDKETGAFIPYTAKVLDIETGDVAIFKHERSVNTAEFSPEGKQIVTASRDGTAKVLYLATGRIISFHHQNQINTAKFSADGRLVVTTSGDKSDSSRDNTARVWDVKRIWDETDWKAVTVREVQPEEDTPTVPHKGGVISAEFSPDGERIVTASFDGTAKVYNLKTGKITTIQHQALIVSANFRPTGDGLLQPAMTIEPASGM